MISNLKLTPLNMYTEKFEKPLSGDDPANTVTRQALIDMSMPDIFIDEGDPDNFDYSPNYMYQDFSDTNEPNLSALEADEDDISEDTEDKSIRGMRLHLLKKVIADMQAKKVKAIRKAVENLVNAGLSSASVTDSFIKELTGIKKEEIRKETDREELEEEAEQSTVEHQLTEVERDGLDPIFAIIDKLPERQLEISDEEDDALWAKMAI